MNVERMLKLAKELERPSIFSPKFNMRDFIDCNVNLSWQDTVSYITKSCGTTACIGGQACLMFGEEGSHVGEVQAKLLLGLNQDQANRLFYNYNNYIAHYSKKRPNFEDITRAQAAAAVRRMVREEGGE